MRPAGGVSTDRASSAASNAMPLSSRTASTPRRLWALNSPTTRVSTAPRPHGVATESAMPPPAIAMPVAATSAFENPYETTRCPRARAASINR